MPIYISTSYVKQNLKSALDLFVCNNIINIELGSTNDYIENLEKILLNYKKNNSELNFTIHGYFPADREPFVMNLASQDPKILNKSINKIKNSVELCNMLGIGFLTIHPGFCVDPAMSDLGEPFNKNLKIYDRDQCFKTFLDSVKQLCVHAKQYRIKLGIENQVVAGFNLIDGQNKIFLMASADEFVTLIKKANHDNLGVLIDFGHLKVTSKTLGFGKLEFIDKIKDNIVAFHAHDNDAVTDCHGPITMGSWFLPLLRKKTFKETPVILESMCADIEQIKGQIEILKNIN